MYIGLHVKYPLFCQILKKLEFSPEIFEKYTNVKFNNNSSSGSLVVPCEQTDGRWYRRIDRNGEGNSRFHSFAKHILKRKYLR